MADRTKQGQGVKLAWQTKRENFSTGERHSKAVGAATKGRHNPNATSLYELSSRTVRKIIQRLHLACSQCGWDKGTGDVHHINGRKVPDADGHWNLTYLCPNCHRLAHEDKINKTELITLEKYIGESWKDVYFG